MKQIRQGQVWQVLRENGVFSFIYTNDQKNKKIKEYIPYFPAVDYYVYQKNGAKTTCNTKNIFLGETKEATEVQLNYELNYLPNLITNQTQHVLHNVTRKEGKKTNFIRYRNGKGFSINPSNGEYQYIYTYNKKHEPKYQYSNNIGDDNVNMNKIIINFDGGIDCYTVQFITKEQKIGSYEMTMYSKVETDVEGKHIENFFSSDIVKFIFLITQYASGKMTKNEPLVANSITIPPEDVDDYYAFFDIENDKKYIEDILTHFYKGSKNIIVKEVEDDPQKIENEDKEDELENEQEVEPKKSPIKLDEKIVLVPETEATEDIPIAISSPIPKKKRTIKKRPKLILVESSDDKVVPETPIVPNAEKIFNPLTKRYVKNTKSNRKKIEKQTLKRGGKSKKRTRKNKDKR